MAGIQDGLENIQPIRTRKHPMAPRQVDAALAAPRKALEDGSSKPNPLASQLHRLQQEVLKDDAAEGDVG